MRRRCPALAAILLTTWCALGAAAGTASSISGQPQDQVRTAMTTWPIVELRQYTLHPGQTDTLIDLFEREFIESQEALGMKVLGQFRDLDRPDRFVWIRGFRDMAARGQALTTFYDGPVWRAHREQANATMVDSNNVLLLHPARPHTGFAPADRPRASNGAARAPATLVVANIYYFDEAVGPGFLDFFDRSVRPQLVAAGIPVLASFVTETATNNFPRLPVREQDLVLVWFSRFADVEEYERRLSRLTASPGWAVVAAELRARLARRPEVLRLRPTPRSELR